MRKEEVKYLHHLKTIMWWHQKKREKKSMQLNKAVPSKHSNGESGRDCGMKYILLKPVSFISSLALNKLLLKESLPRKFYGRNG